MLSDDHLTHWQQLKEELHSDPQQMHFFNQRDAFRRSVRGDILAHWQRFQNGQIDIETFRSIFDTNIRTDWDILGLKGMSGAMFLNILVKYLDNQTNIADRLRDVMACPATTEEGYQTMRDFQSFLNATIEQGMVTRRQIQPARLSFFLSAFWHLQNSEMWPVYYISAREVLETEGLFQQEGDPTDDYFQFRNVYITMMQKLNLSSWEFEHLCIYYQNQQTSTTSVGAHHGMQRDQQILLH